MPEKPIEVILMGELVAYLATPIMWFDSEGTVLFYNEPAESILGRRFDETGTVCMRRSLNPAKDSRPLTSGREALGLQREQLRTDAAARSSPKAGTSSALRA